MPIEVTARHMHATEDLQEYARSKAQELLETFHQIEHIHVILDIEKHGHRHIAEVVTQVKHHGKMEAAESSDNLRVSIDLAIVHMEKQLRKLQGKVVDQKRRV